MNNFFELIKKWYSEYFSYLVTEITNPSWTNYFYALIIISMFIWALELLFPWRKNQPVFRKDFWLDTFYMFFNFFLLNLILLIAFSNTAEFLFIKVLASIGLSVNSFQLFNINVLPKAIGLSLFFIIADFVQWATHRLIHRVNFLWNFHKVHHSVKQMGFAAHLRYHWMEPVVYKSLLYIPLAIIGGLNVQDVVIVHFITITIGHLNHANIGWDYGIFKYIFNNPKMHIWHHTKILPLKYGANFAISLSIWDYLFKTNYLPTNGRDNELGFEHDDQFPKTLIKQELYPLKIN